MNAGCGWVLPSSGLVPTVGLMPRLEQITYDAGRSVLADQESLVAGIRQRTGTLLAAHALVASFLGATTVKAQGLQLLGWLAVAALLLGLVAAAVLLAPWRLKFAVDARGAEHVSTVWSAWRTYGPSDHFLASRAGGKLTFMAPQPLPPEQIKPPSTSIGIEEGRGGSLPRPAPSTGSQSR